MRIKVRFFIDVPDGFTARGYGSAVSAVRRALAYVGLKTSVWHLEYIEGRVPAVNSNGPTGKAS